MPDSVVCMFQDNLPNPLSTLPQHKLCNGDQSIHQSSIMEGDQNNIQLAELEVGHKNFINTSQWQVQGHTTLRLTNTDLESGQRLTSCQAWLSVSLKTNTKGLWWSQTGKTRGLALTLKVDTGWFSIQPRRILCLIRISQNSYHPLSVEII